MFTYKYGGKDTASRKLVVSKDKVVVRTIRGFDKVADAVDSDEGKEVLSHFKELERYSLPDVNVTMLGSNAAAKESPKLRDQVRRTLKSEPEVIFAGRVLEDADTGEPVVYTENLFVKFRDGLTAAACKKILEAFNLKLKDYQPEYAKNAYFVEATGKGLEVFHIAEELLAKDEVEAAHPELIQRRVKRALKPTKDQWHLGKTDESDAHVNIEDAWRKYGVMGKGITIAIIDDGVEISHGEFSGRGKVVAPHDVLSRSNDPNPQSNDEEHGTNCAGIACASGEKAPGIAPEAALMPIRLAPGVGSVMEAAAFYWAVQHGADVISCSWGPPDGYGLATTLPDHTRYAIDYAVEQGRAGKGCVVVWAAGNGNEAVDDDGYASYKPVIAVGACTKKNKRSSFSDYGQAIWCSFPGGEIIPETERHGLYTTTLKGGYTADFTGTSAACPGIAGLAALILCANPQLTYREVKAVLRLASVRLDETDGSYDGFGRSPYYGYGRPDASEAIAISLKMQAEGLGGNDFVSDEATLEAITFRINTAVTTRAEVKKHLREKKILGTGWTFKNVEHTQDAVDALYTAKKRKPGVKEVWDASYRLREQPGIVTTEPSFILPVPGVTDAIHARIARSINFCVDNPITDNRFEWSLEQIRVPEAWDFSENHATAKAYGEDILIGHPDSGYRDHRELDADRLVTTSDMDFIDEDDETEEPSENGNHGLGTATVIMSSRNQGTKPYVTGVAPKARLMPLRVAKKTLFPVPVLVFGGMRRLRRAINHAVDEGCHVISISLGGIPNSGVQDAIERAVSEGVIVCAAAGNLVGWVTYPGSDKNVIGVAASNIDRKHWKHSCRGSQVDVTAPGELVWRALIDENGKQVVERSCGTSFSVAITAGIAALWLSHHGREHLVKTYSAAGVVTAFKEVLLTTCSKDHELPAGTFGAGIVDAEQALKATLPVTEKMRGRRHVKLAPTTLDFINGMFDDISRKHVRDGLTRLLRIGRGDLGAAVEDVGGELLFRFATDPRLYINFKESMSPTSSVRRGRAVRSRITSRLQRHLKDIGVSERLKDYLG